MSSRIHLLASIFVTIVSAACEGAVAEKAGRAREAPSISLVRFEPGPGDTTQVVLAFSNAAGSERQLKDLSGKVVLQDDAGEKHELHPISLGIDKSIIVPAKTTLEVPLLFKGRFNRASRLTFQSVEVAVPPVH